MIVKHEYPKEREVWVCDLCGGIIEGLQSDCWCDVEEDEEEPLHATKMIKTVSLREIE